MNDDLYRAAQKGTRLNFDKHLEMLIDPDQPLSRREMAELSNLDGQQSESFRSIWRTIDSSRRVEIIQTLNTLAEDNVDLNFRPIFLACLDDPEDSVRATAIDGLWEDENLSTLRRLLALIEDPSSEVRVAVLLNLSQFAYRAELGELAAEAAQAIHTTLLQVVNDSRQPLEVQRRAIEALGYFAGSAEAQEQVGRAFRHPNQRMRESAVVAMGRSMQPVWLPAIEHALQSDSSALRFAGALATGEFAEDGRSLITPLLPLVDDDDPEIAQAAVWALGQLGGSDARRVLQRVAASKNEALRQAAQDALAEMDLEQW